jgi:hypothetical protein
LCPLLNAQQLSKDKLQIMLGIYTSMNKKKKLASAFKGFMFKPTAKKQNKKSCDYFKIFKSLIIGTLCFPSSENA